MVRTAFGGVALFVVSLVSLGCGGFSKEKAEARCDQELFAKAQCVTDSAYQECVACYQECGDSCEPQATCPETYSCDSGGEDTSGDTSSQ